MQYCRRDFTTSRAAASETETVDIIKNSASYSAAYIFKILKFYIFIRQTATYVIKKTGSRYTILMVQPKLITSFIALLYLLRLNAPSHLFPANGIVFVEMAEDVELDEQ